MSETLMGLNKSSVAYFSSSGPGSCRYIVVPKYGLEIKENNRIDRINKYNFNVLINMPSEIKTLDATVENDLIEFLKIEEEYNEAIKKYEQSKKKFFDSETGKKLNDWISPEKPFQISEEDAVKKVYDNDIFNKLSQIGDIIRTKISVKKTTSVFGDTIHVLIVIKNKESFMNTLLKNKKFTFDDFPSKIGDFSRSIMKLGEENEIEYIWNSDRYPNYRYSDLEEVYNQHNIDKKIKLSHNVYLGDNNIMLGHEFKDQYINELKNLYT
jgi:hypothetical protein